MGGVTVPLGLQLLVERLHWPVPRVRWEAARQLAGLVRLGDGAARGALLAWNAEQRLESDAATLPSLIQAWDLAGSFTLNEVAAAVAAPSVLSDALLRAIYPGDAARLDPARLAYGGEVPATDAAHLFDGGIGTQVPQIFRTMLERVRRSSGVPMLALWRREWLALQERWREPYSSHPDYFLGGDRGTMGPLDLRQRAVFVSAYLRALAAARAGWGMPWEYAVHLAALAVPFIGGLANFEGSDRPAWTGGLLEEFDTVGARRLARRLWSDALAAAQPGFEPISLDVVDHDERLLVRVEVQRVIEAAGGGGGAAEFAEPRWTTAGDDAWSLGGRVPVGAPDEDATGLRPLCVAVIPHDFGRAHVDLFPGRLLVADPLLATGEATFRCEPRRFVLDDDLGLLSELRLWFADWAPVHARGVGLVGSLTTCRRDALRYFRRTCDAATPRLARVTVMRRGNDFEAFATETHWIRL